jgi:histone-lysine N-methyltransferase SETMAR
MTSSWNTDASTQAPLQYFKWELCDHPSYSTDLAMSDYHLFTYLRNCLGSQSFNNKDLIEDSKTWLSSQVADFLHTGIQKRIPQYDKCLNYGGDYVEKLLKYVRIFI